MGSGSDADDEVDEEDRDPDVDRDGDGENEQDLDADAENFPGYIMGGEGCGQGAQLFHSSGCDQIPISFVIQISRGRYTSLIYVFCTMCAVGRLCRVGAV